MTKAENRLNREAMHGVAEAAGRLASELDACVVEYDNTGRLDTYGGDLRAARARLQASPAGSSADIRQHDITVGGPGGRAALLVYLNGAVDMTRLEAVPTSGPSTPGRASRPAGWRGSRKSWCRRRCGVSWGASHRS